MRYTHSIYTTNSTVYGYETAIAKATHCFERIVSVTRGHREQMWIHILMKYVTKHFHLWLDHPGHVLGVNRALE